MEEFDIELSRNSASPVQQHTAQQRCTYCNAPLNGFFYFCTGCGMPYKDVTTVLSAEMPRQLSERELVHLKAPAVWPMFWTYLIVILVSGGVSAFLLSSSDPELGLLFQMGTLFITTCIFAAMYWTSLTTQLLRPGFGCRESWGAIGLLVPLLALNYAWSLLWMYLLKGIGVTPVDWLAELDNQVFRIMAIAVFPAIVEEIAFRGLIQHWLQIAIKPWRAIILASFLFALMHGNIVGLPYLFLVGMLLGWAKWKSGSLYPSMLIHFLHNLVVIELFPYL